MDLGKAPNRFYIEMIIVIMGDKDQLDGGQILKWHSGRHQSLWPGKGDGAGAVRPVGISQDVDAIELNEERGMPDPGDGRRRAIVLQGAAIVLNAGQAGGSWMKGGRPRSRRDEFQTVP